MAKRKCVCIECGRTASVAGRISHGGLCAECGDRRYLEAARQIAAREGAFYDAWLNGSRLAIDRRAAARSAATR